MSIAPRLTGMEEQYITAAYRQIIDETGQDIIYKKRSVSGTDTYDNPIITYTQQTITGLVTEITRDSYIYIEPGLEPSHIARLYEYRIIPNIDDHIIWQNIEWTIRHFIPLTIGNVVAYYDILIRRSI